MDKHDNPSDIEIEEAEIVSEENASGDSDQASVLVSLGELIKSHIQSLDRLRSELKEQKQMMEDGFINNEAYRQTAEEAKEAAKKKGEVRHQITQQPGVQVIHQKVKSLSLDVKEKQMALSDYLLEYQRMAGVNEVEGYDGEVREIVNQAKLVKKSSKSK